MRAERLEPFRARFFLALGLCLGLVALPIHAAPECGVVEAESVQAKSEDGPGDYVGVYPAVEALEVCFDGSEEAEDKSSDVGIFGAIRGFAVSSSVSS